MKTLLLVLTTLFFTLQAQAATVWVYRVEPASMIKGGKLKIYQAGAGKNFRKVHLKYKLDTSFGFKESVVIYNIPSQVFDSAFLASMAVGKSVDLGPVPHGWKGRPEKFKLTRQGQNAFLLSSGDGQFRIYPQGGGAWARVDFTIRGSVTVRLKGNLVDVGNE